MDIAKVSKDSQINVFFGAAEQEHSGGGIGDLEARLGTGLGRCVGTVGGSLLFLLPAVAIASQLLGGLKFSALDEFLAETQKQLGVWDPNLAKLVNENRGAIAAAFGGLSLLTLALIPGVCGDASLGKAATEQLSSKQDG